MEQDTERILDAFREGRNFANLPPRVAAWDNVQQAITGGFSLEKAKLLYASWRLVKLAQKGAQLSGDASLYASRIEEFERHLAEFLA